MAIAHCQESINSLPLGASLYATFLCVLFGANPMAIKISLGGFGIFTVAGAKIFHCGIGPYPMGDSNQKALGTENPQTSFADGDFSP